MYKDNFLLVKTKTSFKSTYQNFHVVLVGFQTEAKLNSDWNSPSFYTKTMVRVSSQFERAGDLLGFFKNIVVVLVLHCESSSSLDAEYFIKSK